MCGHLTRHRDGDWHFSLCGCETLQSHSDPGQSGSDSEQVCPTSRLSEKHNKRQKHIVHSSNIHLAIITIIFNIHLVTRMWISRQRKWMDGWMDVIYNINCAITVVSTRCRTPAAVVPPPLCFYSFKLGNVCDTFTI